jgi:hypothetical protein
MHSITSMDLSQVRGYHMAKIVTNGAGVHMLVESSPSMRDHPSPHFTHNISEDSKLRITNALAKDTLSWMESAKASPSLKETCDSVVSRNEIAASELGLLGKYQYILHCMTN